MPSWFPGAGFKSFAAKLRPEVGEIIMNQPWDELIADIEVDNICFVSHSPFNLLSTDGV